MKIHTIFFPLLFLLFLLFFVLGCTKTAYIIKQGHGQLALEWNGRQNADVLKDSKVKNEFKKKILQIENYKKFFFKYFEREETGIYNQTTFLKDEAVSYLVIASPATLIEPVKVSFPIVGEFPYLGFFSLEDAQEYESELKDKGLDTYLRPVYAYSTLDQWIFDDNILSSFFVLDRHDLAELIFHELTHTIFFVRNEVDLNESLAQYFGERLTEQYFNYKEEDIKKMEHKKNKNQDYAQMIANFAKDMKKNYKKKKYTAKEAREQLNQFLEIHMKPRFKAFCLQYEIEDCTLLGQEWNNARLVSFLTYQKEQSLIAKIHKKYKFSLKELLVYFEKEYKKYKKVQKTSFTDYLKTKEKL